MSNGDKIEIRGARAHNLKNVDVDIPRHKLVVVTGLSGSGKSSLAFDTIYAEGQRRYMNTLSPYAKHFMGILEKPEVESVSGLSPIIAIEQKTTGNNPRSTVGTITEISDFLRLLYARASKAYSPDSGREMVRYTDARIVDLILSEYDGQKCILLAPLVRGRKGHYRELFEQLRKKGYAQVRIDGEIRELAEVEALDRYKAHFVELVVDKMKPGQGDEARIRSSVSSALSIGKGSLAVLSLEAGSFPRDGLALNRADARPPEKTPLQDSTPNAPLPEGSGLQADGQLRHFSKHLVDPQTGVSLQEPAPHSFSFNSPEGYCPYCKGLGEVVDVDLDTIVPDRSKSVADGGIVPLGRLRDGKKFEIVRAIARKYEFSLYDPIDEIPEAALTQLVYGSDDFFRIGDGAFSEMVSWPGVVGDIEEKVVCPVCHGTRLKQETKCFRIDGKDISEVSSMEISQLAEWLGTLPEKFSDRENAIAHDILKELRARVQFLLDVGLDYLSLDRATASLSGGESQRIRLATQIGSKLVNVIYILDEPSIGLHQRDNKKLLASLKELRDEGNTVVVVEHDEETMAEADWIVNVGPGAGALGGNIIYSGPAQPVVNTVELPQQRRTGSGKFLTIKGASGNNLKNLDVSFPLGCLIGISGVSGSGKSSLINETLMPILKGQFYNLKQKPLPYAAVEGMENIDKVIEVDQSPIGRTPRSNPATFTGVFNDIRDLFEATPDAKVRGFKAGRFSFNVAGGRCEECKGAGIKVIEMNFLPSVNVVCEACRGQRYKEDTLAVKYKGKNINDVLEMPISEAYEFFKSNPKISAKLKAMVDVGLGYVHLGQSAVTLSGGESQRMKLAAELARKSTGNTLYMLDEPTTGLHMEDVKVLLSVLQKLVDQGNTVIVIEHNLDVLKSVDYLIDMGPEGGRRGGMVMAKGTPEQVAEDSASVTGKYLKGLL